MVSVLASSAVGRWFEARSGQTKDYKIGSGASPLTMQQ
jgi:streptogramin lyase